MLGLPRSPTDLRRLDPFARPSVPQPVARTFGRPELLRVIPNPSPPGTSQVEVVCPEVTFFGSPDQPDVGAITLTVWPYEMCVELKSLKLYLHSFRQEVLSYERFAETVGGAVWDACRPRALRLSVTFLPRGGLATTVRRGWSTLPS